MNLKNKHYGVKSLASRKGISEDFTNYEKQERIENDIDATIEAKVDERKLEKAIGERR